MLVEAVHRSDRHTLEELGREGGRVRHEEVSNGVHVFLEGGDLLLGLFEVTHLVLRLALFLLLECLLLHALKFFGLLNLDSHQGLA